MRQVLEETRVVILRGPLLRELLRDKWTEVIVEANPPEAGLTTWVRTRPRVVPCAQAYVVDAWPISRGGYAVVLELVEAGFTLPEREVEAEPELHLTRNQRLKLLAGEAPRITGDGGCPVKVGDIIHLSSKKLLQVLAVRPRKGGGWSLHYSVESSDAIRLLRRGGGYTANPNDAVEEAGEAPPAGWTDPGIPTRAEQQKALERAQRERMSLGQQLDSLLAESREVGADVSIQVKALERRLAAIGRKNALTRDGSVRRAA